jgi:hypothetical protein
MRSVVRAEFERITALYEEADRLRREADTLAGREEGEQRRWQADAQFWAAGAELGGLLLLMLRFAVAHHGDALAHHLTDLLAPGLVDRLRLELEGLVRETLKDDLPDCLAIYLHRRNGEEAP